MLNQIANDDFVTQRGRETTEIKYLCYPTAHDWTDCGSKPKYKMAKMDTTTMLIVGVLIYVVWSGGGLGGGSTTQDTTTQDTTTTIPGGCGISPQFTLEIGDKWGAVTAAVIGNTHSYKINGGGTQTYSGTVTSPLDATVDVLWFSGNTSEYFNQLGSYVVSECGINQFKNLEGVRNTTMTIQCFNEEGNLIGDGTLNGNENETVGTGESVSLNCEIRGVAEKGLLHGGVMVTTTPKDAYVEAETLLSGSIIGSTVSNPSYYTVSNASHATKSYRINPFEGVGVRDFVLTFQAEATVNPGHQNLTMSLYADDCYEDQEANDFKCGNEDEDQAMTGFFVGREIVTID